MQIRTHTNQHKLEQKCFFTPTCMLSKSVDAQAPRIDAPNNTASVWSGSTTGNPDEGTFLERNTDIVGVQIITSRTASHLSRLRESAQTGNFCSNRRT